MCVFDGGTVVIFFFILQIVLTFTVAILRRVFVN